MDIMFFQHNLGAELYNDDVIYTERKFKISYNNIYYKKEEYTDSHD